MQSHPLGRSDLSIAPLVFGGNVFGWTADERTSHDLLDRFVDRGFNAVDTADVYSRWVEGHEGGESETVIGSWLKANKGKRERIVLFTKVGSDMGQGRKGLSGQRIAEAVDASLTRLKTDFIDLYFSHFPDPSVAHDETLRAYEKLIKAGKVRALGASNYDAELLSGALSASAEQDLPRYEVIQPEYNLHNRKDLEGPLLDLARKEEIGVVTYFSLASGFLSGKYRSKEDLQGASRAGMVEKYLDERGMRILDALDEVSKAHGAEPAEVAIAWIIARDGVTAPIASATSRDQLESLFKAAELQLTPEDMTRLDEASA
ncbi:aldo/keto reductase [Lutibaculum baratangense]|uniref:Oxidoreductase n=1 Tax=Lutibaculum baratangense AMV1 TaxID=631454 RepID=V4TJA3_9HYPH|nr:aldo/keto reductase [Lutibaculum baratangense]ESR26003.1 Oxidoreductase [Lutibaculum baratangense AMV1]